MKKIILFVSLCCMVSAMSHLHAQSIINKSWKTYIADPINDTAIFHIYADSSLIANSKGEVMVRNHCKITGDTLTLVDYGTEEQGCPDMNGRYRIIVTGDSFTLTLINDECVGRSHALAGRKWTDATRK